jgi:hypothetical protein
MKKRIATLFAKPREHMLGSIRASVARRNVLDLAPSICASNKLPLDGRAERRSRSERSEARASPPLAAVARAWFD